MCLIFNDVIVECLSLLQKNSDACIQQNSMNSFMPILIIYNYIHSFIQNSQKLQRRPVMFQYSIDVLGKMDWIDSFGWFLVMQDPNQPLPITSYDNAGSFSLMSCEQRNLAFCLWGCRDVSPWNLHIQQPTRSEIWSAKHDHSVELISEVEYSDHYCKLATFRKNKEATATDDP